MRPPQKSNRSRGRGSRKGGGGGGNNLNRVFDSAGPEGKVRGTPQQIIDKYLSLARDAQTSGDRVTSENFLQHAEHYQRILISAMGAQEQSRREAQPQPAVNQPGEQPRPSGIAAEETMPMEPAVAREPAQQQPSADIGGMTMIDADPSPESLLVDTKETATAPSRPNGSGRRQRRRPPQEAPAVEASPEPPAPGAAAES